MRALLVIALLALTGCQTSNPDTLGTGTATSDPADLAKLGTQLDKSDQRVAASIAVASENADKPSVVKAELGVASSYLPRPDATHLDYVRARVQRANPEEYKRAEDAGRKLLAVIDANFAKAEQDAQKNKAALTAANCQIDLLKAEVAQAKKDIVTYTCAGVGGLLALAAVGLLWMRQIVGAIAAAVGSAALLAFPSLVNTPWFLPSLAVAGGLSVLGAGAYLLLTRKPSQKPAEDAKYPDATPPSQGQSDV
jgi:hypothetical protein